MKIVTGCNRKYLPGIRALYNSIKQHASHDKHELWCLVHGDQALADEIEQLGYKTILNPDFPEGTTLICGGWWTKDVMPVMYSRLLIPELFPDDERVLWLDADTIVTGSLSELSTLDFNDRPIAAYQLIQMRIGHQWGPHFDDDRRCFTVSVLLFNIPKWREKNVIQLCYDTLNNPPEGCTPIGVVESVLNWAITGDFKPIPIEYCFPAKRSIPTAKTKILHFSCIVPWDEENLARKPNLYKKHVELYWKPYDY